MSLGLLIGVESSGQLVRRKDYDLAVALQAGGGTSVGIPFRDVRMFVVPVSAEAVVAATSSVVARQEPVRPSVLETAVVADSAVQAAAVVPLQPVTAAGAVAAQSVLPSARTGCPCSSPFSAAPSFRQSSSGPAAWHKDVPVRAR